MAQDTGLPINYPDSKSMKLLTKTILYFVLAMIPILAAGGWFLFHAFDNELHHEMDEELMNNKLQWQRSLAESPEDSEIFSISTPEFNVSQIAAPTLKAPVLKDTFLFNEYEKELVPYRELKAEMKFHNKYYLLTIRKSLVEKNDLIRNVTSLMLLVFGGLLAFMLFFNWLISKKLWQPFHQSLNQLKEADLKKVNQINFPETNISEFVQMNTVMNNMAGKIHRDYLSLKEFTEDAAHEMQTPLAIAQSKLELLIQDSALNEKQLDYICQADEALIRLSKINQALLFLTKIENDQFNAREHINLYAPLKKYLQLFEEMILDKQLSIEFDESGDFPVYMHPLLADSIASNLLGNAIRYNIQGGTISITGGPESLSVINSSTLPAISPENLFKRFRKSGNAEINSTGLGLAIIKQIADSNGISVFYTHSAGSHRFTLSTHPLPPS